jgi:hypothetical protein
MYILFALLAGSVYTAGIVFIPIVLMLLFRQKYPKWWFDWNLALTRFNTRVSAYIMLLRDEYPSTDEEQAVHIDIPYPNAKEELKRWLPLVKWIMAIPHYIVLIFLQIAAAVVVIIAWFAILFTFSLGTAAGDLTAEQFKLGYLTSIFIFAGLIAIITIVTWGAGTAPALAGFATWDAALATTLYIGAALGVALVLSGVASMIAGTPKTLSTDSQAAQEADKLASYQFSGPVNAAGQGNPVPVVYGELIVGSQVVSMGIRTA